MTIGVWELWSIATKVLIVLASTGVAGGYFIVALAQWRQFALPATVRSYLLFLIALGLVMVPVFLLVQVGGINRSGLSGMFDVTIANIVWHSGLGDAAQARLAGLLLAAAAAWSLTATGASTAKRVIGVGLVLVAATLLATSFALSGHVATLTFSARVLLVLHVMMVSLWIGALYPLLQMSRALPLQQVTVVMQDFGRIAIVIVMLLLMAGLFLALTLLTAPGVLATPYGRALLWKLLFVCALLFLAARNNIALVPRLETHATLPRLQNAIRTEMLVAIIIVTITAWLTTVTGPGGM